MSAKSIIDPVTQPYYEQHHKLHIKTQLYKARVVTYVVKAGKETDVHGNKIPCAGLYHHALGWKCMGCQG